MDVHCKMQGKIYTRFAFSMKRKGHQDMFKNIFVHNKGLKRILQNKLISTREPDYLLNRLSQLN